MTHGTDRDTSTNDAPDHATNGGAEGAEPAVPAQRPGDGQVLAPLDADEPGADEPAEREVSDREREGAPEGDDTVDPAGHAEDGTAAERSGTGASGVADAGAPGPAADDAPAAVDEPGTADAADDTAAADADDAADDTATADAADDTAADDEPVADTEPGADAPQAVAAAPGAPEDVAADATGEDAPGPTDAGEPVAGVPVAETQVPDGSATADEQADEQAGPDEPVADEPADPDEPVADERAAVVAPPRPLAPPAVPPLAAWPSWDDVAVTAPAAADGADEASAAGAAVEAHDGAAEQDAAEQDATDVPGVAATSGDGDGGGGDGAPDAPRTDASRRPAPIEPMGLSALAFTALNAASVGVPAHALAARATPGADEPAGEQGRAAAQGGAEGEQDRATEERAPLADEHDDGADAQGSEAGTPGPGAPGGTGSSEPSSTEVLSPVGPAPDGATQVLAPVGAAGGPARTSTRQVPDALLTGTAPEEPGSPLDVFEPQSTHRRWPRVLAVTGGALLLLVGAYVGASYATADRVPRGATVAGVELGGLTSDEAEQRLTEQLAGLTTQPVPVLANDVAADLDPVAAGLTLDPAATVARLTGVDLLEPGRLWRQITGVGAQPPVTSVDEDALAAALDRVSESLTLAPVDGAVLFVDGAPQTTDAVDGWDLEPDAAADALTEGWLTAERPLALPTTTVEPAITQAEVERALTEVARPLASAPVAVLVADRQAVLDVPTLTGSAAFVPSDGTLELQLDGEALSAAVLAQLPDLLTEASDARFDFRDGSPFIVAGTPGTTLDPAALAAAVAEAATGGGARDAAVELVESDPAQTTEALEALGVKEIVSEFSTPLTSEPKRTRNIEAGLRNITGTLVRPGETFSLTEALGPVDAAHGFVQAGAIVNGEHRDAWGGGLSQVSTTVYNAAYFAGFEDVEHTPHSEWFQRYPEGREATIFTGVLDMKWKNNTPYGALVQGYVADGRAHVRIWGTKHFRVETSKSGRSGVVSPTTVYSQSATCEPQSAGNPGFTVTNTRKVYLGEELVSTESSTWRYKPQNRVVCGAPPQPGAPTP